MFLILIMLVCIVSSSSIATCKDGDLILNKQAKDIHIGSNRLIKIKCICVNYKFPFTKNSCSVPPISDFKKIYMCDKDAEQWMFQQNKCVPFDPIPLLAFIYVSFILFMAMKWIKIF